VDGLGAYPGQFNLAAGMSTTGSLTRWFQDQMARELPQATRARCSSGGRASRRARAACVPALLQRRAHAAQRHDGARCRAGPEPRAHARPPVPRDLEGVACGVRHNVETLSQLGRTAERVVAVGGGAQTDVWLQIVSDVAG
jgi:xylulokinase